MSSSFQILCGPFFFIKLRTICCSSFLSLILLCRRKAGRPPSLSFSYKFYHQHFDFLKLASRDKKRKFFLCSLLHLSVCMSCLSTLCSFVLFLSFCSCNFLNFLSKDPAWQWDQRGSPKEPVRNQKHSTYGLSQPDFLWLISRFVLQTQPTVWPDCQIK